MKVESVQLENIRSHVKTLVDFSDGFNCLVGGLGTGKSSVLYAVDFALFGEPIGRSYDYLLREGAETGRIVLNFVKDGKEYTIQRALKRQKGRISQDMEQLELLEEGKLIAEMKSDAVAEQLRSVTGIDKDIFREIIWVRQERLKDVLNMPPGERQKRLDQLFGLSDYEASWVSLRPVIKWFESEENSLERDADIVGIVVLESEYNEAVKDLAANESELERTKVELAQAEKRLEESSVRLQNLESVRRRNEELRNEESGLRAEISGVEASLRRLADEKASRKNRTAQFEERLRSLRTQEQSVRNRLREVDLPVDFSVEQLREHVGTLREQIRGNLGVEESLRNEIKRSTQRISTLVKENTCPLCLRVLNPDYKDELMKRLHQETAENRKKLNELEKDTERFEHIQNIADVAVQNLQTSKTRVEEVTRQKGAERSLFNNVQRHLEERQKTERTLKAQLVELRSKIKEFDIAEFEEAQKARNVAFEQCSVLKHRAQAIDSQKNEILKRTRTLKERLDVAQKKNVRLEKVKEIIEVADEIRQAYRSIQPKLRKEFVAYLEKIVQQVLDELTGPEDPTIDMRIDENYTPIIRGEGGYERSVSNLSGGERTLLAFAYRLGVGQLIMQWRAGYGLRMLLLDEPTESLGREDGSIDRLAESLSRLRSVEQVIAVTHSEAFAEKADYVIRLEKRDSRSVASAER
ncbi:MAG: SMC family ATPase [Candidatus Bathyarchaeota archaeon]|nr:SMC family ATPase [Candidatus Bathyarchaeota archaeon]